MWGEGGAQYAPAAVSFAAVADFATVAASAAFATAAFAPFRFTKMVFGAPHC